MNLPKIDAARCEVAADFLNVGISGDVLKRLVQAHLSASDARDNARESAVTIKTAAARLDCSESTIWGLLRNGTLPRVKLGKRTTRIPERALNELCSGGIRC